MSLPTTESAAPVPMSLKVAAVLIGLYAVWSLGYATRIQVATGWAAAANYPRSLVWFTGLMLIVYGLLRRYRWAWWLGLLIPGALVLTVVASIVITVRSATGSGGLATILRETLVGVVLLGLAILLLLFPASRAAIRPPDPRRGRSSA